MSGGRLPTFFSPDGIVITRDYYRELIKQTPDPYLLRQFENDKVSVQLRKTEKIYGARDIPKEHWKMFGVIVENIINSDPEGNPLPKVKRVRDTDASKAYRSLEEATSEYDLFLAKYTDSKFDDKTGKLIEKGNVLAPPDPDVPVIPEESSVAEHFGSW